MDKNEILAKSRKENKNGDFDERDKDIRIKGYRWAYAAMGVVCIVLMVVEENFGYAFAVFSGKAAFDIYETIKKKKTSVGSIIYVIASVAIAVGWLLLYLFH